MKQTLAVHNSLCLWVAASLTFSTLSAQASGSHNQIQRSITNNAPQVTLNTISGWSTPIQSLEDTVSVVTGNTITNANAVGIELLQPSTAPF